MPGAFVKGLRITALPAISITVTWRMMVDIHDATKPPTGREERAPAAADDCETHTVSARLGFARRERLHGIRGAY